MNTSHFLRAAKTVFLGMAAAQAIPILGSLIIARLYSPLNFGAFSAWLGMVLTAAVVVTGRLETSLAVEPDGKPRELALRTTLATIIFLTILLAIFAVVLVFFSRLKNNIPLDLFSIAIPATLLMAVMQTWQSWAAAEGKYKELSWMRITQALGVTGFQIILGRIAPNAIGLACGHLLGLLLGIIVALCLMPIRFGLIRSWKKFRLELFSYIKEHRRFPLFSLPADLLNAVSGQLPLIIIASKFGAEASGLFALTIRVLGAPIGLLGVAVLDVFKRTAASSFRTKGNCRDDYVRTFKMLSIAGIVLALGVMFTAETIFVVAYGESWRYSGNIAIWLMPMFVLRFVASPLSYVFYIVGKQQVDLIWQCALLTMTAIVFTLGKTFQSSVEYYAFGYGGLYVVYILLSFHYSATKINLENKASL